jgi:hypothetical protein
MNILPSSKLITKGRPTTRVTYHRDGTKTEVKNPRPGGFSGLHGGVVINNIPDEFRGVTAGRYQAAPGVSFEQASEGL